MHIVLGYVVTITNTYQYQMSFHINQQPMTDMTISALSSETSSADGGRFTTTYTALQAQEPWEAEAGVITLLLA